ncbi:hypothetical protein MCEMIEM13_01851 [Comamonadaceae bacterium]
MSVMTQVNKSIDADPQKQEAASPLVLVVQSSSRCPQPATASIARVATLSDFTEQLLFL